VALAERATLIAELRLDDKMSRGLSKASGSLSTFSKRAGISSKNLQTLGTNLLKIGAVAAVGIGAMVKSGISSLAELESSITSVNGAIETVGLTGETTGAEVAAWANEIESNIQAAFDDKAITAGAAALIRYGKVTDKNLKPAMVVMADLAAKTGDVDSAATLLARALADPEKAAAKLVRQGIVLTKTEQAQIKALMKAGKAGEAQAVILKSLERTTKGAAAAMNGPYKDALLTLDDVSEDAKRGLAEGFLPVITKVADKLKKGLADPATMAKIREFGKTLAGGLDSLLSIAERLPWGTIADSMRLAGAGARTLLDAFTKLPPWVQTAVITGWGLNKLTGGAIGGIVGELGKGLIRGVLGMNAGVVNINAAVVNGGGLPVGAAAAGAAAGTGAAVVTAVIAPAAVAAAALIISDQINKQGDELVTKAAEFASKATDSELAASIKGVTEQLNGMQFNTFDSKNKVIATLNTLIAEQNRRATGANNVTGGRGDASTAARVKEQSERAGVWERAVAAGLKPTAASVERTLVLNRERNAAIQEKIRQAVVGADTREAQRSATLRTAVTAAQDRTTAAAHAAAVASALTGGIIRAKDMSPTVNIGVHVTNNVSVRQIGRAVAVNARWQAGSRNVDRIP
jgi:hypothetical protein